MTPTKLKSLNIGGWEFLVNEDLGYAPYFTNEINYRINHKRASNIIITGEAGISKSYQAFQFCRVIDKRFTIDDIVFGHSQYMEQILKKRKKGVPIMLDEPQYALDKRDWYLQTTKALVKTMTSQRFRLRPLYIPIINMSLIEKTVRSYLLQFHVVMRDHGIGTVYRLHPSQTSDKIYRYTLCNIEYGLFDRDICDLESCLECRKMELCEVFRAQYERKKLDHQEDRDEQSMEEALAHEAREITDEQIVKILYENIDEIKNEKDKVDTNLIRIVCKQKAKIPVGRNKALYLRTLLFYVHPELAPEIEDI